MTGLSNTVRAALFGTCMALAAPALLADAAPKNWTPPAHKIYAQTLVDQTMASHPELLSMTLHGVPPGQQDSYTMFAGSYPERIGNPDDPDDIDVSKKGITILDPRWKRVNDKDKKFVVLMPLQDAGHENVGLVVYAFKNPIKPTGMEWYYLGLATKLRDELARNVKTYNGLFDPAN
jgi:hypothetical protein